jgi:hypothetical protein
MGSFLAVKSGFMLAFERREDGFREKIAVIIRLIDLVSNLFFNLNDINQKVKLIGKLNLTD